MKKHNILQLTLDGDLKTVAKFLKMLSIESRLSVLKSLIENKNGSSITKIVEDSSLSGGLFWYHLNQLEKMGFIESHYAPGKRAPRRACEIKIREIRIKF